VSPLEEGRHTLLQAYSHLYVAVLNNYDLISSKLMRGTSVDFDDCVSLFKSQGEHIEIDKLVGHFNEMVDYDVGETRIRPHMGYFLDTLKEEGLI